MTVDNRLPAHPAVRRAVGDLLLTHASLADVPAFTLRHFVRQVLSDFADALLLYRSGVADDAPSSPAPVTTNLLDMVRSK